MDSQVLPAFERLAPPTIDDLVRAAGVSLQKLDKPCSDEDLITISSDLIQLRTVAPRLGLKEGAIEEIEIDTRTEGEKRLKVLRKWKETYGSRATYRVLIEALLKCNMADLVEKVCCLLVADPQECRDDNRGNALEAPATTNEGSVQNIFSDIREFEKEFHDLADQAADDIEQSIKEGKAKLSRVKSTVTRLPVSLRHHHIKFLAGKLSAIDKAETVNALFSILDLYWDFMNCGLLELLIDKFGSEETQQRMEGYLTRLKDFRMRTTVREFTGKWTRNIPSNLSAFKMEVGDGWLDKTLEAVEEFKTEFSRLCSFENYALPLIESSRNSVILCWGLQRSFSMSAEFLEPARRFFQKQGVLRVIFKQACFQVVSSMEGATARRERSHMGSSFSLDSSGFGSEDVGEIPSHEDDKRALQFADDLHTNRTGRSAKFTKTTISEEPATKLGDALRNNKSLQELELVHCKVSPNAISSLVTALDTNTSLITLRLHDCGLSDQATIDLAEALQKNTTLLELDLGKASCRNKITSQGASALAEMLCKNKTIKDLSLFGNEISDIGVRKLAKALLNNESLEKLDLSTTKITSHGASSLALALRRNHSLKILGLWGNKLADSGMSSLAKALHVNESLEELDLCFNTISDKGVGELSAALLANKSLKILWFSFDNATNAGADELATAIEANCTLIRLELVGTSDISEDLQKRLKDIAEEKELELTLL